MLAHLCIDPLDPYAEQEVLVEFQLACSTVIVRAALDEGGFDILPDLEADQVEALRREILAIISRDDCATRFANSQASLSAGAGRFEPSLVLGGVE